LEGEPAFLRSANLLIAKLGFVLGDEYLLVPAAARSSIDEQLSMACEKKSAVSFAVRMMRSGDSMMAVNTYMFCPET
jgi:hypothetical protein